ncbi:hypothetical protein ACYTTR_16795 [Cobetia marina]
MEMTTPSTPASTTTEAATERPRTTVSTLDLAAAVTKGLNERHETLQAKATAELVREVFEQVRQQIETTEDGVINIRGLGVFNCRTVTRESAEGGEPQRVKRVNFKVAKAPK